MNRRLEKSPMGWSPAVTHNPTIASLGVRLRGNRPDSQCPCQSISARDCSWRNLKRDMRKSKPASENETFEMFSLYSLWPNDLELSHSSGCKPRSGTKTSSAVGSGNEFV